MSHHAGSSCSCSSLMSIADTLDCAAQVAVPVKTLQQGSAVQDYALHDPHDKTRIVCRLQVYPTHSSGVCLQGNTPSSCSSSQPLSTR